MINVQNLYGIVSNELPGASGVMSQIDDVKNPAKILKALALYMSRTEQEGNIQEQKKLMKFINRLHLESSAQIRELLELLVLPRIRAELRKKKLTREFPSLFFEKG